MGAVLPHVLGRNQRFFARQEATPYTYLAPLPASAMKVLSSSMTQTQPREFRTDASQVRNHLERITRAVEANWSVEMYGMGSGAVGVTPPNCHALLLNHFGSYAQSAGVSDTYSRADTQTAYGTLSLVREFNAIQSQAMRGCMGNVFRAQLNGGEEPRFTFEGMGAEMVGTGYSLTTASALISATTVVVADGNNYEAGSVIQVGTSDNNAGTPPGHLVTAVAGNSLTISPGLISAQSSGVAVIPYVPVDTGTLGSPIAGILGSLTLGGVALPITSATIESNNNHKPFTDQAFTEHVPDYTAGRCVTTASFVIRARRDHLVYLNRYNTARTTLAAVVLTTGNVAGSRYVFTMNNVELDTAELQVPEAEEALIQFNGTAMGSSATASNDLIVAAT